MRFKDFLTEKSVSRAQQAAIAISKKEKGEEPKNEDAEEKARLALKHTQEKERLAQKHAREKESLSSEDIDYDEAFETTTNHFFNESVLGDARTILFREKLKKMGYARIVEKTNKNTYNMRGHKVELEKKGDSMKPEWHLKVDGKEQGVHKSEKDAIKHFQKITKESVDEAALKTSDYPKGTSMSAQKFKDSQKKMSKQRALSTKDYPKGTSMSATAWKNRQEEVELEEKDVKVPLELLKLYNKGMALPAGSIEHKKVMKQIDDMRKKLGMKESVELDERSREDDIKKIISIMKKYPANKGKSEKELRKGAIDYLDQFKKEEDELDEASIQDIQDILTTIAKSQNMNQAVQMVMKKYKVDQGKAKAMVKKAIDSGVTYDKIKKKYAKESVELDEAIDFRKAFMDIQSYAKKNGGMDKTDFEKVAYYVKAIGDNQNTPNVANKAFMAMKKHIDGLDTDVKDGVHVLLKKHGMVKNGRIVQESTELVEAKTIARSDFEKLKKGDRLTITYDSSIRKGTETTFVVTGRSRSNKYDVDKVIMQNVDNPRGMKSYLYSRSGADATLALGDMGATIVDYVKESVELEENAIELARDVVKNKSAKKGLDLTTASVVLQVYDKVNDSNKKKMETLPLEKLVNAVWKIVNKAS